jgi:hypothetical protein
MKTEVVLGVIGLIIALVLGLAAMLRDWEDDSKSDDWFNDDGFI